MRSGTRPPPHVTEGSPGVHPRRAGWQRRGASDAPPPAPTGLLGTARAPAGAHEPAAEVAGLSLEMAAPGVRIRIMQCVGVPIALRIAFLVRRAVVPEELY